MTTYNPVGYVKRTVSAWREWRALSAQAQKSRVGLGSKSDLESRVDQARREFLVSAGAAFLTASVLGITGTIAVKQLTKDPLTRTFEKFGKDFPLSFEYLTALLKNGGVTTEEIEEITAIHQGLEGLYALVAYGLVQRIMKNGEMSQRYLEFLGTMRALVKEGKIRFKTTDQTASRSVDFYYDINQKAVYAVSGMIQETQNITITESSFIHELTHAYQDYQKRTLRYRTFEAEAHIAQSDFIWHVKPELLHPTRWLQVYPITDGFKYKFMVPQEVIRTAASFTNNDPGLANLVAQTGKNYLTVRATQGSANPQLYKILSQQIPPGAPPDAVYRGLKDLIERNRTAVQNKPLGGHLPCTAKTGFQGELAQCLPSEELTQLSTSVHFLSIYAWKNGEREIVGESSNLYFLGIWQREKDALLNHPGFDVEMALTGIQ